MARTYTIEESVQHYGTLMLDCMRRFRETPTKNFANTVRWIKGHLYSIDMNPRYATLVLFLQYNIPDLEEYATEIWDNLHI